MKHSSNLSKASSFTIADGSPELRHDDPRWKLAESVVAGTHFARAPLLSRFLLYVVNETIEGRSPEITEHKIGVAVFGRPITYRTDDDNIVRNYARQLRRRLSEHFATCASDLPMRIEIPVGGYVPIFPEAPASAFEGPTCADRPLANLKMINADTAAMSPSPALHKFMLVGATIAVFCALWFFNRHRVVAAATDNQQHEFWQAVMPRTGNTFVVPPDVGFNLVEDIEQQTIPLASYVRGTYQEVPLTRVDEHTRQDIEAQQYTDFVSMQMVANLARQPEYDPQHVLLRFPRDLRLDDLKRSNALIIGSVSANPWAALSETDGNFHIVPRERMQSAAIVNMRPAAGEANLYQAHWNEPVHETYGLIQFLPNLAGTGHLLFVQGLDVAGTQAAAEFLLHPDSIGPVLKHARRPDGSFRPFEILLRTTSLQSNAEGTTVLASRFD